MSILLFPLKIQLSLSPCVFDRTFHHPMQLFYQAQYRLKYTQTQNRLRA